MSGYPRDELQIFNKQGEACSKKIVARVDRNEIHIYNTPVDVEEGYTIVRDLPNGKKEKYLVILTEFIHPNRYICHVRKETSLIQTQQQSTVYNFNGHNARVNQNSTDNSFNTVTLNSENLFSELRKVIECIQENNAELLESVNEMEKEQDGTGFLDKYTKFIGLAANHISAIAPFIPLLTQRLSQQ